MIKFVVHTKKGTEDIKLFTNKTKQKLKQATPVQLLLSDD